MRNDQEHDCGTNASGQHLSGVTPTKRRVTTRAQMREQRFEHFTLTPQELVKRKPLLNVIEAAYCLNVSERKIYKWAAEGVLAALKLKPLRIKAEDVAKMMNDFDE